MVQRNGANGTKLIFRGSLESIIAELEELARSSEYFPIPFCRPASEYVAWVRSCKFTEGKTALCLTFNPKFYWGFPESYSGDGFTWFLDEAILAEGAAEDWCQLNPDLLDWVVRARELSTASPVVDEFAVVLVGIEGVQPWEVDLIRQYYVEGDYVDGDYVAVRRDVLRPSLELVRMYASCVTGLAVSRILVEVIE